MGVGLLSGGLSCTSQSCRLGAGAAHGTAMWDAGVATADMGCAGSFLKQFSLNAFECDAGVAKQMQFVRLFL